MLKNYFIIFVAALFFVACESPKEKSLKTIREMESKDSIFSPENIEKLKKEYIGFAEKYPDDELAPEFLFKAGQRCNVMAQHQEALQLFQRIRQTYPKHKIAEESLFLQGYIYENSMNDLENARKVYLEFIHTYPNSELAEDAKLAIQNLGKSPEEIFEGFEK